MYTSCVGLLINRTK